MVLGLARPQFGQGRSEVQASGVDIMLAVDVSGSMEALDFKLDGQPANRLDVREIRRQRSSSKPGPTTASGSWPLPARLISSARSRSITNGCCRISIACSIGLIEDGTAIGSAIATCVNRLRDQPAKSKIVVLLTDGMNNAGKVSPADRRRSRESDGRESLHHRRRRAAAKRPCR